MSEDRNSVSGETSGTFNDPFLAEWTRKDREHTRRVAELLEINKTVLFDATRTTGVSMMTIEFDGYGDEGDMEQALAFAGEVPTEMPEDRIEILDVMWGGSETERQTVTIGQAVETLAWSILQSTFGNWQDNEGGFGKFIFDAGSRKITLEYNERISDTEYSEHEF
jgi:hypothetical protein